MKRSFFSVALLSMLLGVTAMAKDKPVFTAKDLALPGKKGACLTLRDPKTSTKGTWDMNLPKLAKIKPCWNYSWGADYVSRQTKYVKSEFVPMVWSAHKTDRLDAKLKGAILPEIKRRRVKRVLGYNEPDGEKQANMTVETALSFWPKLEAMGVPLCSPSAVHADREWMTKFMEGVKEKDYRVDYIGVHSYAGTSAEGFKKKLRKIYELYDGRPLLITEFAPADWNTNGDHKKNRHSPEKVLAFAKSVLPWMEEQDWIAGYAWFSFGMQSPQGYTSALYDYEGDLTALGKYYASITKANPKGDQGIKPDDAEEYLKRALAAKKKYEADQARLKKRR